MHATTVEPNTYIWSYLNDPFNRHYEHFADLSN